MPLRNFMTTTATTTRLPAKSGGKIGNPVTHLENVLVCPVMQPTTRGQHEIRALTGFEGTLIQFWETYTESHEHDDNSVTVTQLPDIVQGDFLVIGSTTYTVAWAEVQPATTSFGATLMLYLHEDKSR